MNCKVSASDTGIIISRYLKGEGVISLAKEFNVGRQAIYHILWNAKVAMRRRVEVWTCVNCGLDYDATVKLQKYGIRVCCRECGQEYNKKQEVDKASHPAPDKLSMA